MRKISEGSDENMMIPKIIGIVFGIIAVGIYAWKFKETPLCRPWIMLPLGLGVGYAVSWLVKKVAIGLCPRCILPKYRWQHSWGQIPRAKSEIRNIDDWKKDSYRRQLDQTRRCQDQRTRSCRYQRSKRKTCDMRIIYRLLGNWKLAIAYNKTRYHNIKMYWTD